jgi:cytochrome c oxidase cbb3-type subunit I/II
VRPLHHETERWGEYSKAGESVYDHPFQWGSRRIGPDLARVGVRVPSAMWHLRHMRDPREISPNSIMPGYPHLLAQDLDYEAIPSRMRAMRRVGVPYTDEEVAGAEADARGQAEALSAELRRDDPTAVGYERKQVIAIVAYLKRLGTDTAGGAQ